MYVCIYIYIYIYKYINIDRQIDIPYASLVLYVAPCPVCRRRYRSWSISVAPVQTPPSMCGSLRVQVESRASRAAPFYFGGTDLFGSDPF